MRHHGGPALTDTGGPASMGSANGPEASLENYESKLKSKSKPQIRKGKENFGLP